ncbi:hypothetical protein HMPREF2757_03730 [Brevibacterium sp. HMSC063G07]|nr:hypothetical protein HMPREF2757_03730 [Brevibacterium sp. HMSC063G07]OFS24821.1 hypothetical protein HMPREF3162_10530 [Brevibacterium sp. HMSC07C04]
MVFSSLSDGTVWMLLKNSFATVSAREVANAEHRHSLQEEHDVIICHGLTENQAEISFWDVCDDI